MKKLNEYRPGKVMSDQEKLEFYREAESARDQFSNVKDIDEPRPGYRPTPDVSGMMATEANRFWDLYLQDEASDVFVDKMGLIAGYVAWMGSIYSGSSGAMFAASAKIMNEKLKMCNDLYQLRVQEAGLENQKGGKIDLFPCRNNYFDRSYLDIWKEWKVKVMGKQDKPVDADKPAKVSKFDQLKSAEQERIAVQKKAHEDLKTQLDGRISKMLAGTQSNATDVDRVRNLMARANGDERKAMNLAYAMANSIGDNNISKIVGRYKAAEDLGLKNIAQAFYGFIKSYAMNHLDEAVKLKEHGKFLRSIDRAIENSENVSRLRDLLMTTLVKMQDQVNVSLNDLGISIDTFIDYVFDENKNKFTSEKLDDKQILKCAVNTLQHLDAQIATMEESVSRLQAITGQVVSLNEDVDLSKNVYALINQFVSENPGCTVKELFNWVSARADRGGTIYDIILSNIERGNIVVDKSERPLTLYPKKGAAVTVPDEAELVETIDSEYKKWISEKKK